MKGPSFSESQVAMSARSMRTLPLVGLHMPSSSLHSVDLPAAAGADDRERLSSWQAEGHSLDDVAAVGGED